MIKFGTKASTLNSLRKILKSASIAPMYFFSFNDWNTRRENCLAEVTVILGDGPWIVRSSCQKEDGVSTSNAGAFLSLKDVSRDFLEDAIDKVFSSFGEPLLNDEVLIQPMIIEVIRSGVAFTHDPNTCSPYRVINWSESHNTSLVTGGGMGCGRVWQQAALSKLPPPPYLSKIVILLNELEHIFGGSPVDCEFAVSKSDCGEKLWLFQARPLILSEQPESKEQQKSRLEVIQAKLERGMSPHPFLVGKRTIYGVMPDWNPAEILGVRPKPLALSLYRDLITDAIWAYQRDNYGYRNLRSFPLMPHFFGLPYIDVRISFNSFVPSDLDETLAGRLVDHYINQLLDMPSLHDKVEFEIVHSCYTLDLHEKLGLLTKSGFSEEDIASIALSLRKLTNRIIHPEAGIWREDAAKLNILKDRRKSLLVSNSDPLERIYWLLEDAKRYGTLPFAGLARAGFIAIQMLKSLVAIGILSKLDYDQFLASISTVSGQMARDHSHLKKEIFLEIYGHLRPGTYDITSPRYDQLPELYFDWSNKATVREPSLDFSFTKNQSKELERVLRTHELDIDPGGLLEFMRSGIELREFAKFCFTQNLSDALELMAETGKKYGYDRDELAYCDVSILKEMHVAAINQKDVLMRGIEQGKARYDETLNIALPPLISSPQDIWAFEWPESSPNYITQKQVIAPVVDCSLIKNLAGAIVCIPNADPGFDWLFSYQIAGLITAWGGVNSHMAIRAGELGIPAIIGAGEILYRRLVSSPRLLIDCAGRRVEVLG